MIEVDKGIPLPRKRFPFDAMEIGDSFFVPADDNNARRVQSHLASSGSRKKPKRFTVRRVDGGYRVWRIA